MAKKSVVFPPFITIRADNQQYLSRIDGKGMFFRKSAVDVFCSWKVKNINANTIALKADDGKWASLGANGVIECSKDAIDEFCKFSVLLIDDNIITLKNTSNGLFLSRMTDGLQAAKISIDEFCKFKIGEPIIKKEIINVKYQTGKAIIQEATPLVALSTTVTNPGPEAVTQTLSYSYNRSTIGTWNNSAGIEVGAKTEFKTGIPFIAEGKIEVSANASYSHEWGGEETKQETITSSTQVVVPAKTKGKAKVVVKRAVINVPFTYKERRTYIDGRVEDVTKDCGIYNNLESYDIDVETKNFQKI